MSRARRRAKTPPQRVCKFGLRCSKLDDDQHVARFSHPEWPCPACTFLNPLTVSSCGICGTSKHPKPQYVTDLPSNVLVQPHDLVPFNSDWGEDSAGQLLGAHLTVNTGGLPQCPNGYRCHIRVATHFTKFFHEEKKVPKKKFRPKQPRTAPPHEHPHTFSDSFHSTTTRGISRNQSTPALSSLHAAELTRAQSNPPRGYGDYSGSSSSSSFSPDFTQYPSSVSHDEYARTANASALASGIHADPPTSSARGGRGRSRRSSSSGGRRSHGTGADTTTGTARRDSVVRESETLGELDEAEQVLLRAAARGNVEEVTLAIEKRGTRSRASDHAFVDSVDYKGDSALHHAVFGGHTDVVTALLRMSARVGFNQNGATPLMAAAAQGHHEMVLALLDHGAPLEQTDANSCTALGLACSAGHLPIVQSLVERKANLEAVAKRNMTPLMLAALSGHSLTVHYLAARGANVTGKDSSGQAIMDFCTKQGTELPFALRAGQEAFQKKLKLDLKLARRQARKDKKTKEEEKPEDTPTEESRTVPETIPEEPSLTLPENVLQWTENHVAAWLDLCGFTVYARAFLDSWINGEVLVTLTEADLQCILLITQRLHRRRIKLEIDKLVSNLGEITSAGTPEVEDLPAKKYIPDFPLADERSETPAGPGDVEPSDDDDDDDDDDDNDKVEMTGDSSHYKGMGAEVVTDDAQEDVTDYVLVSAEHVHDCSVLDEGNFSKVFAGTYTPPHTGSSPGGHPSLVKQKSVEVVIKVPKSGVGEWSELTTHLSVPRHANIVRFVGLCYNFRGTKCCLVTERMPSTLKVWLKAREAIHVNQDQERSALLIRVISDIAEGLAQLHRCNIIHRDVAARNILMSATDRGVLADFGLARAIEPPQNPAGQSPPESYYLLQRAFQLPVRWLAPESSSRFKFSKKSDVWMFGVTVWEILSGGHLIPYFNVQESVTVSHQVRSGHICLADDLPALPPALAGIGELLRDCLSLEGADRPSMKAVCRRLKSPHRPGGRLRPHDPYEDLCAPPHTQIQAHTQTHPQPQPQPQPQSQPQPPGGQAGKGNGEKKKVRRKAKARGKSRIIRSYKVRGKKKAPRKSVA